jgi:hypothetical protein
VSDAHLATFFDECAIFDAARRFDLGFSKKPRQSWQVRQSCDGNHSSKDSTGTVDPEVRSVEQLIS